MRLSPVVATRRRKDGTTSKRSAVQWVRHELVRANEKIPTTIETILVRPQEFAERIRAARSKGRSVARLIRCLDDVETSLSRYGIEMGPYFLALRREARRALRDD